MSTERVGVAAAFELRFLRAHPKSDFFQILLDESSKGPLTDSRRARDTHAPFAHRNAKIFEASAHHIVPATAAREFQRVFATLKRIRLLHVDYLSAPAPELEEFYPVRVWKKPYLGTEKSIDEINAKRGIEYRRLFDVRKNSGEIVMWGEANSGILRCQPDSGYVFNMNITNSGGYKVVKRMRLMPKREVDFEPSIYDSQTGLAIAEYVSPETSRMRYEQNSSSFSYTIEPEDIHVYFRENKDKQDGATSLSISFYDPSWNVIDPRRFNETNWGGLFQAGFLKGEIGPKEVVYDMAYPLPLFNGQTKYTDSKGEKASVKFATSWFSKYGYRNTGYFVFDFAIYKEAHWEMLIHFAKGMPQLGEIKD